MCQSEPRFAEWVRLSTLDGTAGTQECLHPDELDTDKPDHLSRYYINMYNVCLENDQVGMEANMSRTEIAPELLDAVAGGALGFDPDGAGTFTMRCEFSGESFPGLTLAGVMELAQFGASIPNTPEGEQEIIAWARSRGFI